jgi:hypothetical protein
MKKQTLQGVLLPMFQSEFLNSLKYFCFELIFLIFFNYFDMLLLKIYLKNYYFILFLNKKYFKI